MRTTGMRTGACPECGAEVVNDDRFVVWCAACEWNVAPQAPVPEGDRTERRRRALARRHGEKLLAEVTAGDTLRAHRDTASLLAQALALAVHGITFALAAAGIWVLVTGWGSPVMVLGLLLLGIAWPLRPRLGTPDGWGPELDRATAPQLFALVDEVASVIGTRGVDEIRIDASVNASVLDHGLRGRRLLTLGLPLWEVLTPRQRIALLGHELAHYSNGDTRHGRIVGTACRLLATWSYYFAPTAHPTLMEALINLVYAVPRIASRATLGLLDRLTLRSTQRAEYLADRGAARAASTEAAVELMDLLLVTDSVAVVLRREGNRTALGGRRGAADALDGGPEGLWERLREHMESVPEHERERLRRVSVRLGHSVDSTHPPTHLRRTGLLAMPAVPAAVSCDDVREQAIRSELAQARTAVARRIAKDGYPC